MDTTWNHHFVHANGIRVHYVRHGAGFPLILLHGWPGFWYVWRKNILPLAEHFDVIVPDQRGFGDTDKPDVPAVGGYDKQVRAEDLRGMADALGLERFGIVTHDIGSWVAQVFALRYPERVPRMVLFDMAYPGIGDRWRAPDHIKEIWYTYFHQQPWAAQLVGASRDSVRTYFRHFLGHWAHDGHTFDEDLEIWVDTYMKPGNLQGGFNWYVAVDAERTAMMRGEAPRQPVIDTPTRILWGASDKVLKVAWADRLGEYFSNYTFTPVPEAGHFLQYEQPDLFNAEVIRHFAAFSHNPSAVPR